MRIGNLNDRQAVILILVILGAMAAVAVFSWLQGLENTAQGRVVEHHELPAAAEHHEPPVAIEVQWHNPLTDEHAILIVEMKEGQTPEDAKKEILQIVSDQGAIVEARLINAEEYAHIQADDKVRIGILADSLPQESHDLIVNALKTGEPIIGLQGDLTQDDMRKVIQEIGRRNGVKTTVKFKSSSPLAPE